MADNKHRRVICTAVAHILQQERTKRKMTLANVAEKAGLSYQMVGFVEKEKRNPSLDTMLRICHALELDLSTVLLHAEQASKKEGLRG